MKYREIRNFARNLRVHQTSPEILLWEKLRHRQVEGFKFLRQHPILFDRRGNDLNFFIPDFYCAEAKLVIEIDGGIHNRIKARDDWRQKIIENMGLKVIRFRNEEIANTDIVVEQIRDYLKGCK